jgi:molybdopterin-synthase adenylyltransferase
MALSSEEVERYARHLVLPEIGGPGQNKLKTARVLVIGAGGLGAPLLLYLAAAGVGTIGICDNDTVSLSNLQRQVIHTTAQIKNLKTQSAADMMVAINPHINIVQHPVRITADNAMDMITAYDVVADGCDNFNTRFLVADACYFAQKPLVSAAVGQFDGQISTYKPYLKNPQGELYLPLLHWRSARPRHVPSLRRSRRGWCLAWNFRFYAGHGSGQGGSRHWRKSCRPNFNV